MDRRVVWSAALVAAVFVNSFLGLLRPMTDDFSGFSWEIFGDVWAASFLGDVIFTLGSMAVAAATWWVVSRPDAWRWAAAPAWFVADLFVYAAAWQPTGRALDFDGPELSIRFVLEWGWVGLTAPTVGLLLYAIATARPDAVEPRPAPRSDS